MYVVLFSLEELLLDILIYSGTDLNGRNEHVCVNAKH